jgi:eukaryotic-like serine/threonine-protein kinase
MGHAESRASGSPTLPPELMAEAAWRLGSLGLVYAVGVSCSYFGRRALLAWSGLVEGGFHASDAITITAILMGLAVFAVSRRAGLPPARMVNLGLLFQVLGALGIAAGDNWRGLPPQLLTSLTMVPRECVWIILYPLVVPNTPRNVFFSSLLAASMGPAVVAIALVMSRTEIASAAFASYVFSDYLSAIVAYAVARIVYRFHLRLKHAREIGSYELIERIGEGGMGEVWRAHHRFLARPAALKLIRKDLLAAGQRLGTATTRRFEREAQATAMLGSTHTIGIYDFGVTDEGDFYYVMELLDGVSLDRFVQLFGPMEPARIVYLLAQVCHSLDEAHGCGLVHRDIKPGNIFMCRLGPDYDFVKVLDFGLVKRIDARAGQMLTAEGMTSGTPAFMAPETALGRADADGRVDIYALGCVAYYLLTGQFVFSGATAVATALAHVNEQPAPPSSRSEFQIPPALEALILECLAKDPAARPASAADLACRLVATVPPDAWTAVAAREWWAQHDVALAAARPPAAGTPTERAPQQPARHRCWPRLDDQSQRVA